MNLAQVISPPTNVEWNGVVYRFHPLRDRDYGEWEAWLQDQYITRIKRNVSGLSDVDRQRQLDRVFDKVHQITLSSPASTQAMGTLEGVGFMYWLSLRREMPDLTISDVLSLVTNAAFLNAAIDAFNLANARALGAEKKHLRVRKKSPSKKRRSISR